MQMTDPVGDAPEGVPEEVVDQAKAVFARRTPGEIAVLVWDSLIDADDPAEDHRLVFQHADIQIEVRIYRADEMSNLEVRVKPAGQLKVELQSEGEEVASTQPIDGAFMFTHVPAGVVRLAVTGGTTPEVRTDWFRI